MTLTRTLRAAAAVLLAVTGLVAAAPARAAEPAEITGTITDAVTGQPIPGVLVAVATAGDYGLVTWTGTDAAGHYALEGLTAGTEYVISAAPPAPYRLTWLPGDPPDGGAPPSFVAPATVDAALASGTRVSGTLRDSDGSPVAGATVNVEPPGGDWQVMIAITDPDGKWSAVLEPGTYVVAFAHNNRFTYAYGQAQRSEADPIVVGRTPLVIDDQLPPQTLVSGRVTDAATGAGVQGVCATLEKAGDPAGLGWACTDANGDYLLTDIGPGRWVVRVEDPGGRYATTRSEAFDLAEGQHVTHRDVVLTEGGTLTGLAVDRATGAPLADICPSAYAGRTDVYLRAQLTCSDASGRWSIAGLPAGDATVLLNGDATHVSMWAGNSATQAGAKVVSVVAGSTVDAGTVRLRHGGAVTGTVTNQAGQPVAGVWVELGGYNDRCGFPCGQYGARTGSDGTYRISNVEPRTTIAAVVPWNVPGDYAVQWSGGATDPARARKLTIGYDRTTRLDAVLAPEAQLSVTLTGLADGEYASIDPVTLSGARVGFSTDAVGPGATVTIGGLPASRVKLRVLREDDTYVWYGGTDLATATPVRVTPTTPTTVTVPLAPQAAR